MPEIRMPPLAVINDDVKLDKWLNDFKAEQRDKERKRLIQEGEMKAKEKKSNKVVFDNFIGGG